MDRDKFLSADEAKEFGLVDEVFDKRPATGRGCRPPQAVLTRRDPDIWSIVGIEGRPV